jgi:hypothetical protein
MARSGWGSGFKPKKFKSPFAPGKAKKPEAPPAPRKPHFETLLCDAVRQGVSVEMRYDGEEGLDQYYR